MNEEVLGAAPNLLDFTHVDRTALLRILSGEAVPL